MKGRNMAAAMSLVLCAWMVPPTAVAGGVEHAAVQEWLANYGAAWELRDADRAAALFTESATYHENPHEPAFQGRKGIHEYWARVTADQRDISFSSDVITVFERSAVAHWSAQFTSASSGAAIHLDGIFLLDFADDGLCSRLREWWIVKVEPPPAGE